jgi:hypothetical protein
MAPAIYTLFFGYLEGGFIAIKPVVKLMLGIWAGALLLSLVYQLLTRYKGVVSPNPQVSLEDDYHDPADVLLTPRNSRHLTEEERQAHQELLDEEPIRAVR